MGLKPHTDMANLTNIKTIFLDIGGVLLTNGWDHDARRRAVDKFNLDYEEVNERHHLTFDTYEEGKLDLDEYLARVIFYEERSFTPETFKEFMFSQTHAFPDMINFIRALKSRYYLKTLAVSNEGRELNEFRIKKFKLDEIIDAFVSSSFVHYRKPDKDIFHIALDISQTDPRQVVYLDDRLMFVEVARQMGINAIHHKGFDATKETMAELGLIAPGDE
jgi:putative hydrolase of the HAD superfamily